MRIITIAEVVLLSNIRNNGVYLISSYSIGRKKGKKEERVEGREKMTVSFNRWQSVKLKF